MPYLRVNTANCARLPRRAATSRALVWIEQQDFLGFGCSKCSWRFEPSDAPTGTFDEMKRHFELQRDREFSSHVCAEHPPTGNFTRFENWQIPL
jgi:hypothetical protein